MTGTGPGGIRTRPSNSLALACGPGAVTVSARLHGQQALGDGDLVLIGKQVLAGQRIAGDVLAVHRAV
jgi:hypothetical protein